MYFINEEKTLYLLTIQRQLFNGIINKQPNIWANKSLLDYTNWFGNSSLSMTKKEVTSVIIYVFWWTI